MHSCQRVLVEYYYGLKQINAPAIMCPNMHQEDLIGYNKCN